MTAAIATPSAAPQITSSGLCAPTYTRATITRPTSTHGTSRHRAGRYGVITPASAATRMAWPDTKLSPERLTSPRVLDVRPDRRARALPADHRLDEALRDELGDGGEERGDGEPVAAQHEGDDGDDRSDDERAELLERPEHGVERLREVVDGVEDRLLPAGHGAIADDERAERRAPRDPLLPPSLRLAAPCCDATPRGRRRSDEGGYRPPFPAAEMCAKVRREVLPEGGHASCSTRRVGAVRRHRGGGACFVARTTTGRPGDGARRRRDHRRVVRLPGERAARRDLQPGPGGRGLPRRARLRARARASSSGRRCAPG